MLILIDTSSISPEKRLVLIKHIWAMDLSPHFASHPENTPPFSIAEINTLILDHLGDSLHLFREVKEDNSPATPPLLTSPKSTH